MIVQLALRNITYRPWRSVLLFFGFGVGVAVMIVLLSIGEAMLSQARNEKLVGGGTITVLPEGLDVEVMKTGGIGGLFFSIDHASFLYRQVLASPRNDEEISAVAPQIEGRLLYVRTAGGQEFPVYASGEIPAATKAVGAAPEVVDGTWDNDDGDRRWVSPAPFELRNEIDHFHMPSDSVSNRDTWAEWHYFNVLSPDQKRWAFISFIVGGDVTSTKWGGQIGITLREQNGATRRFATTIDRSRVRFSTTDADLVFGSREEGRGKGEGGKGRGRFSRTRASRWRLRSARRSARGERRRRENICRAESASRGVCLLPRCFDDLGRIRLGLHRSRVARDGHGNVVHRQSVRAAQRCAVVPRSQLGSLARSHLGLGRVARRPVHISLWPRVSTR